MLNTLFNCWKAVHYRWFLAIGHLPNLCRIFVVGILYFTIPNTPLPSSGGEIINFTEIGENAICIIGKKSGQTPSVQIVSQLFMRVFVRGLLSGVFCLEGFVRGGFCPYPLLSEHICYNRKLKITLNFVFQMYDNNI